MESLYFLKSSVLIGKGSGNPIDKYKIEELIGRGEFSLVYRVTLKSNGESRAFKVIKKDEKNFKQSQELLREIQLLEECPIEQLNDREIYWINYYDSYNNGYNLTLGGQDSNYFNINKLENTIDIKKFKQYIIEFKPLAIEVAQHFNISKCSVYNLIKRLDDPSLVLNSYNPRKGKTVDDIDKNELIKLYMQGWSIQDLVKKYHIRKNKISEFLRKNNIQIHRGIKGYKHRI